MATNGTSGSDSIVGTAGSDEINGLAGNDTILGLAGNDSIDGGPGNDLLIGGPGRDTLRGGAGSDTLIGGGDGDILDGGAGNDSIIFNGDDAESLGGTVVIGGSGHDTLDYRWLLINGYDVTVSSSYPNGPSEGATGMIAFIHPVTGQGGVISFSGIEDLVTCFTPGTLVATPNGEVPVEDLRVGDRVITRDNGIQKIRWVGRRDVRSGEMAIVPDLCPVMIRAGSLGNGLPEADMMVSPNHRMLIANERTALYFDEHEVLVAAKHLVGWEGITKVEPCSTAYIHIMFDRHEVVLANGAWSESFNPGDQALGALGEDQRREIMTLFPELAENEDAGFALARRTLKRHEAAMLVV